MAVAIANARQNVQAPTRTERRFGLFSVADIVDGGEQHWIIGGLTADGEQCSEPLEGAIGCGPSAPKTSRSWYGDINGDPWLAYMYETCKTVGRVNESAAKLRSRFLASEQSAVEAGFQKHVLNNAYSWGAQKSVADAIGKLEQEAGEVYGGQITLHLPFRVAEEASKFGLFTRYGSQLETTTGSLVSVGNYSPALNGGTDVIPVLYATGGITLYRSSLMEAGPSAQGNLQNDYYTLIERAYAGLIDCFMASATAPICDCTAGLAGDPQSGETDKPELDEGSSMTASALGIACDATNAEVATALNIRGVTPNPLEDWGVGNCASIDCGADVDREVRWNGHAWVGC